MAKTVKKTALEPTIEEVVSGLALELKPSLVAKRIADAAIKPLKERLIMLISENKETFLPESAKSCVIEGVLVTITTEPIYEYGEGFDLVKFYKAFPTAIKFEFKTSEMKNIPLTRHDIKANTKPKNTVELVKKKEPNI